MRELARRGGGGVIVRLLWDSMRDCVILRYSDPQSGDRFATVVPKAQALRAFNHPNAYRP